MEQADYATWFRNLAAQIESGEVRVLLLYAVAHTREGVSSDGTWLTLEPTGEVSYSLRVQKLPAAGGGK